MCRSAMKAAFLLCVFGTEVLSYMGSSWSVISMQTRFAAEQVPPSSALQAPRGRFHVDRSVLLVETRAHSHFDLHSCRYNSFMWQPDKAVFLCPGSTVSVFHCSPLSTNSSPLPAPVLSSVHFTSTPPSPFPLCSFFTYSLLSCVLQSWRSSAGHRWL